jgi:hypothetical protein
MTDTLKVSNNNSMKVKLVAIAKDEGAYIPDWVHHHLYFGFDAIDVFVNRTTDNTISILEGLKSKTNQLNYYSADWIDRCPNDASNYLQFIVYAQAFEQEKSKAEYDYVMFLDIDEFWMPQNAQTSIQDCLKQNPNADILSFGWINEHGGQEPFKPISRQVIGQLSPLVKSAIRVSCDIREIGLHGAFGKNCGHTMVDGDNFFAEPLNRECLHPDLIKLRSVMIVHRMFRSPIEYVSLLSRGRPSDSLPLKLNRKGFNKALGTHVNYVVDESNFDKYEISRRAFFNMGELINLTQEAQQFVYDRAKSTLTSLHDMPLNHFNQVLELFVGCPEALKQKVTETLLSSPAFLAASKNQLLALASTVKSHNIQVARHLLVIAAEKPEN